MERFTDETSSSIASASWEARTQTLEVTFRKGARWRYEGVTEDVWCRFVAAASRGRFYQSNIRGRYVSATRVDEGPVPEIGGSSI